MNDFWRIWIPIAVRGCIGSRPWINPTTINLNITVFKSIRVLAIKYLLKSFGSNFSDLEVEVLQKIVKL